MFDNPNSGPLEDAGKLLLRLALGILILFHGVNKIQHGIAPIEGMISAYGLPGVLGNAVYVGEVVAPLMLIAGFYARIGAALIVINMVVALLLVHTGDILMLNEHGGWRLELQAMYLFSALALALTGPGRFALDARRSSL